MHKARMYNWNETSKIVKSFKKLQQQEINIKFNTKVPNHTVAFEVQTLAN